MRAIFRDLAGKREIAPKCESHPRDSGDLACRNLQCFCVCQFHKFIITFLAYFSHSNNGVVFLSQSQYAMERFDVLYVSVERSGLKTVYYDDGFVDGICQKPIWQRSGFSANKSKWYMLLLIALHFGKYNQCFVLESMLKFTTSLLLLSRFSIGFSALKLLVGTSPRARIIWTGAFTFWFCHVRCLLFFSAPLCS